MGWDKKKTWWQSERLLIISAHMINSSHAINRLSVWESKENMGWWIGWRDMTAKLFKMTLNPIYQTIDDRYACQRPLEYFIRKGN